MSANILPLIRTGKLMEALDTLATYPEGATIRSPWDGEPGHTHCFLFDLIDVVGWDQCGTKQIETFVKRAYELKVHKAFLYNLLWHCAEVGLSIERTLFLANLARSCEYLYGGWNDPLGELCHVAMHAFKHNSPGTFEAILQLMDQTDDSATAIGHTVFTSLFNSVFFPRQEMIERAVHFQTAFIKKYNSSSFVCRALITNILRDGPYTVRTHIDQRCGPSYEQFVMDYFAKQTAF